MSRDDRDDRDQRGGHPLRGKRLSGPLDCGCCEHVPPKSKSPSRAEREREAARHERAAEG